MSYTSIEIVRKHIIEKHLGVGQIESESLRLVSLAPTAIKYPPVLAGTDILKAVTQTKPDFQIIGFAGGDKINLNKKPLVRDTVVVASDSSLGTIYQENIDYLIDHQNGTLTRIEDGAIAVQASVAVWYLPYNVYTRDSDYRINNSKGEITRLNGGDIESGQWLYVDYDSEFGSVDDDIIGNAINEANEQVLNFIDSAYAASSDKSLVLAETYLAVSIICRIKAIEAAGAGLKENVGSAWTILSEQYKREAYLCMEKFAGLANSFTPPRRA
jgi:hypothetical protein